MRPVRVGIDVDGVVANFAKEFSRLLQEIVGEEEIAGRDIGIIENREDVKSWNFGFLGYTKEEMSRGWQHIANTHGWWSLLELIDENDAEHLYKFSDYNADIYFITSRPLGTPSAKVQTQCWLDEMVGCINPSVIVSSRKAEMCQAIPLDYYIDDNLESIVECEMLKAIRQTHTRVYIYDYPHNRQAPDATSDFYKEQVEMYLKRINRVSTLSEFLLSIEKEVQDKVSTIKN